MMNLVQTVKKTLGAGLPSLDDWLDPVYADERRTVEFKRRTFPANEITCELWAHNYKGVSISSVAKGQNTGDVFAEALAKIQKVML